MKAAGYDVQGAPGVLKYVDIPDPVAEPDDVLISVEAISIEGDLINRRSTPPPCPSWVVGYAAAGSLTVDLWSPMQSNQTLMGVFIGPLLKGTEFGHVWTTCCRLYLQGASGLSLTASSPG